MSRLTSLRHVLDRQERNLEGCSDDTAASLLCAVKALSREVAEVDDPLGDPDADVRSPGLLEKGLDLLDRIRGYDAQTSRGWFTIQTPAPSPDDTETTVLTSDQMYMLAHGMARGATEPPPALREAAVEAQGIGHPPTTPCPPPEDPYEGDYMTKPTRTPMSETTAHDQRTRILEREVVDASLCHFALVEDGADLKRIEAAERACRSAVRALYAHGKEVG